MAKAPSPETPPPTAPSGRSTGDRFVHGTLLGLLGLVLPFVLLSSVEAVVWMLGIGIPLAIMALFFAYATAGRRMRARGEGLELMRVVRGPLRTVIVVRGEVDGRVVRVYRHRVEVEVDAPEGARFPPAALAAIVSGNEATPRVRAAAQALIDADVRLVEVFSDRAVIHGSRAPAAALVPSAIELALAHARIRWAKGPRMQEAGCPFCKQPVASGTGEPSIRCPTCDSLHHAECWQDHGGCSVFRCRRAPPAGRDRGAPAEAEPVATNRPLKISVRERA